MYVTYAMLQFLLIKVSILKFDSKVEFVADLHAAVKEFYIDDVPHHLHRDSAELSMFHVMSYDELITSSPEALQGIFRHKNIVVTGMTRASYGFDEDGLRTLSPNLDREITIHGWHFILFFPIQHHNCIIQITP